MLETNRCLLTKLQQANYEDVKKLYVNEEVRKYLGGTLKEETIKKSFFKMVQPTIDSLYWVAREKHSNEFIGLISLDTHHDGTSTEVSYQLLPQWWGAGYATELVKEIIDYAFNQLNLPEVIAETQTANNASRRLLERLGMELVQTVQRFGEEQAIYIIKNS
ncbi:GNAT family N-acetyltransferase [Aneurinibacillus migulanus]|uniref:GNAT family N-acetyltransferase n=1 Tax=Aneurinibacillus migulanus TaxID=47500 RepID=UPI0020A03E09|nr:GNAT family N-acetyltransferase [Aneurinibacillus migulanus]MCP1355247.1 GNAT family N-acetyltransferase [Aneurinibacillus migulanus]